MVAKILPLDSPDQWKGMMEAICNAKKKEIQKGVDGFLFYDTNMFKELNMLWDEKALGEKI